MLNYYKVRILVLSLGCFCIPHFRCKFNVFFKNTQINSKIFLTNVSFLGGGGQQVNGFGGQQVNKVLGSTSQQVSGKSISQETPETENRPDGPPGLSVISGISGPIPLNYPLSIKHCAFLPPSPRFHSVGLRLAYVKTRKPDVSQLSAHRVQLGGSLTCHEAVASGRY